MGTWETLNGGSSWVKSGDLSDWATGWPILNYAYTRSYYGLAKSVSKNRLDPSKKYAAFGGFAWTSDDAGSDFINMSTTEVAPGKFLSNGLDNINGNSLDVSDANPNTIYVGYYDLGFWVSRDHGASWKFSIPDHTVYPDHVWGGGGGSNSNFVLNDPAREQVVWSTFGPHNEATEGAVFKSTAYGENWQMSNDGLAYLGGMTHGISIDVNSPVMNRTLFVTQEGDVFKSINDGENWTKVLINGGLKFTAVDQFNSMIVYAGGESGLWRSEDGGTNWAETGLAEMRYQQQIPGATMRPDIVPTFGDPDSSPPIDVWNGVFEIKTDPNVANRVYVAAYGPGKGLYRSDDAGLNWAKLYNNDYLRGIAISPSNSNLIYISSTLAYHSGSYTPGALGILYSEDTGGTWTAANDGMSWTFGGKMEIETGPDPSIWAWSPGTGVQHALAVELNSLPIELTYFEGSTLNNGVHQLDWQVNLEENFDRFEVERSRDGFFFTTLDVVQLADSSSAFNTYHFLNPEVKEQGDYYYRLKMLDIDETYVYSDIVLLKTEVDDETVFSGAHPNPANQSITFKYNIRAKSIGYFSIVNPNGETIKTFERELLKGENNIGLEVKTMRAGPYFLLLKTSSTHVSSKFIVVK